MHLKTIIFLTERAVKNKFHIISTSKCETNIPFDCCLIAEDAARNVETFNVKLIFYMCHVCYDPFPIRRHYKGGLLLCVSDFDRMLCRWRSM